MSKLINVPFMDDNDTRPAAPVEGLETVGATYLGYFYSRANRAVWPAKAHELVVRSQAEAIVAAERAEKEIAECNRDAARENFLTMQKSAAKLLERAEKAEADNAALTARVKEYFSAQSAYNEAVRPSGGFGHPKTLKANDPIVIRYRESRAALEAKP